MITENQAISFAEHWVQAWNSHDLDAIVSHYEDDVVLVLPISANCVTANRHQKLKALSGIET
ncbi:nuclear transport factor 2 family protein [Microcoleus sp. BROC3]|uniref:nuclear transport factor 2 family protein n=1 Tax=Microcoleus sp. BROC3 TaxID=3055323 RepID=UPI002FCEC7AE